jgi:hypothetical protein
VRCRTELVAHARVATVALLAVASFAAVSDPPTIRPCCVESLDDSGANAMTLSEAADLATIAATIAALAALPFAYFQIRTSINQITASRIQQNEQLERSRLESHASLLMQLDERWEGDELETPRNELAIIINEAIAKSTKGEEVPEFIKVKLKELETTEIKKYADIMKICGFFETVGLMCRNEYTNKQVIIDLLYGSITYTYIHLGGYILYLKQTRSPTAYDNYAYLANEARRSPPKPIQSN